MYYFEVLQSGRYKEPGIYKGPARLISITYLATRVWRESEGKVVYIKNRIAPANTQVIDLHVDLKEFMFIKLKAKLL